MQKKIISSSGSAETTFRTPVPRSEKQAGSFRFKPLFIKIRQKLEKKSAIFFQYVSRFDSGYQKSSFVPVQKAWHKNHVDLAVS